LPLAERSIVRTLLAQGFTVYLTDWQPPDAENAERGFDAYVNGDLACAVNHVRVHEGVERVPLVGCCFGGLLALLYAALHPENVARVVPVAAPIELQSPFAPTIVEYVVRMFGNVPGWWIRAWLIAGIPGPEQLSRYVADELQEPALIRTAAGARVARALQPWLESDVPLTSIIALEIVDPGTAGIDRMATRVWVDGALAFDGAASPAVADAFGGPRAGVTEAPDTLRIVLAPGAPFLCVATDLKQLMAYLGDPAIGDGGFIPLGGGAISSTEVG